MDQRIIDLYHEYLNAPLRRRIFLKRLAELTGSEATALTLVPIIESRYGPQARASVPAGTDAPKPGSEGC
jgi:carboxymethylenebutenolidase